MTKACGHCASVTAGRVLDAPAVTGAFHSRQEKAWSPRAAKLDRHVYTQASSNVYGRAQSRGLTFFWKRTNVRLTLRLRTV